MKTVDLYLINGVNLAKKHLHNRGVPGCKITKRAPSNETAKKYSPSLDSFILK
jgi:hypothetical protein